MQEVSGVRVNFGISVLRLASLAAAIFVVAGSASAGADGGSGQEMQLQRSSPRNHAETPADVHYDESSRRCSAGSIQLISPVKAKELIDGWHSPTNCSDDAKTRNAAAMGTPEFFAKLRRSGSAVVLVRLKPDGSVESVHALCASDADFAQAAEDTAKAVTYEGAKCWGVPTRSAFFLPFHYQY